jgi:hypothetical protein
MSLAEFDTATGTFQCESHTGGYYQQIEQYYIDRNNKAILLMEQSYDELPTDDRRNSLVTRIRSKGRYITTEQENLKERPLLFQDAKWLKPPFDL